MKKYLSLLIIAILLNSQAVLAVQNQSTFSDVDANHPQYTYIMWLYDKGVVGGYPDGTFQPDNCVNRAEFLKMLYTTLGKSSQSVQQNPFSDVIQDSWYYPFVISAYQDGIIQGYPDGTFKPEQCVSKPEALKMAVEAYFPGISESFPTTGPELMYQVTPEAWFYKYFAYAMPRGLLVYDPEFSDYYPIAEQGATRADIAETLWVFEIEANSDGIIYEDDEPYSVIDFTVYEGIDEKISFSYPSSWSITDEYFYETASGAVAEYATIEFLTSLDEIVTINGRMVTCGTSEFDAYCLEHQSGILISSFDDSMDVIIGMSFILDTMSTN